MAASGRCTRNASRSASMPAARSSAGGTGSPPTRSCPTLRPEADGGAEGRRPHRLRRRRRSALRRAGACRGPHLRGTRRADGGLARHRRGRDQLRDRGGDRRAGAARWAETRSNTGWRCSKIRVQSAWSRPRRRWPSGAASATARRSGSRSASSGCRRSASRWSGRWRRCRSTVPAASSAATICGARPMSVCRCSPATSWRRSRAR